MPTNGQKAPPAKKPVTSTDIARYLGLSQRTVSQALSGRTDSTSKVSDKTRQLVEATAKKLGYRPNRAARALRTGKTGLIGIWSYAGLQHHPSVRLHAALVEMRRLSLSPLVYTVSSPRDIESSCHAIHDASVDGILLLEPPPQFDDKYLALLKKPGRVIVAVGGDHLPGIPRYSFARANGFAALATHLREEGRRSICFMVEPTHMLRPETDTFISAIRAALDAPLGQRSPHFEVCQVKYPSDTRTIEESPVPGVHVLHSTGYLGLRQLLASGKCPDAIMCRSDSMAQGVILACHQAGIAVPEQMAVTGFDDEPSSSAGWIPITSVGMPHDEIIRPATEELRSLLQGERESCEHLSHIPGKVAIRQSSRAMLRPLNVRRFNPPFPTP